jgi:lipopolysaccharide/colanic/teichoic acid biosynthesis glycosyltransferase
VSTGTVPVVQPEPQTAGEARRTAELEASQSLARRYAVLAHTFEPRPVDAVLRGFDVVISGLILLVLSPLIALLSLAVLLTSGRPVLYQGARVGRAGRTFHMYKLRTLRPDAEARLGPYQATELDRRTLEEVTRLGALLRASQLDELPQLWNVLRGQMSIVGPRPVRPVFFEELCAEIPQYWQRLVVRPGLTGFAQIRMRRDMSWAEKLAHDLEYLADRSVGLYLRLLLATGVRLLKRLVVEVPAALSGRSRT